MKLAFHYAPKTFLYIGSSQVHEVAGYKNCMLPELATWVEIPNFDERTQQLRFSADNQKWFIEPKPIKVIAYHKQTQVQKQFDDRSLVDDDHTTHKPLPYSMFVDDCWVQQIDLLRDAQNEKINQWRNQQEIDTSTIVKANGHRWDAGPESRARIDSTLLTEKMPPYWTDADNVDHIGMSLDELKQVKMAIGELGFLIHDRQRTMKKEIDLITDFAELEAYPIGWPEK